MNRFGMIKATLAVAVLLVAVVAFGGLFWGRVETARNRVSDELLFSVFRGEFVSSIIETGDIESSSKVEIRCEVKGRGRDGTVILDIVPEGTLVGEGDFICQLDDSVLRDQWTEQKIEVAEDRAALIQAESDLDTARRALHEYESGKYEQERNALKAEVATAEEGYRRAKEFRRHSESLNRKGFRTQTQLEADIFAEEKAKLDLELARQNLRVYEEFTRERIVAELRAEIAKQEARVEATRFTLQLSETREAEMAREVAACRIMAPSAGLVVYANEIDRRGDASFVIEEGAKVRDGQPIVYLPDPTRMQVRTKVNDSKINQVQQGQRCEIRVDTDPEQPIAGIVRRVSSFPLPRRWYQAPIEYEVFVEVTENSPLIRSGLRGKVEIFVERLEDAVQAPLSSLFKREEQYYVFVQQGDRVEPRAVEVDTNNEKFAVIRQGLKVGEQVVVDADHMLESFSFPQTTQP